MKYAPERKHTHQHVTEFSNFVYKFFDKLTFQADGSKAKVRSLSWGSGFPNCYDLIAKVQTRDGLLDMILPIDAVALGPYESMGLQLHYEHSRPIDMLFSFNTTPREWMMRQARMREFLHTEKSPQYHYAILHDARDHLHSEKRTVLSTSHPVKK